MSHTDSPLFYKHHGRRGHWPALSFSGELIPSGTVTAAMGLFTERTCAPELFPTFQCFHITQSPNLTSQFTTCGHAPFTYFLLRLL